MNIYSRKSKYLLLILTLTLLLQACAPVGEVQPTPEPVTLKLVLLPYLSFAPFFIAEEEGYFAEQALEIEFVEFKQSAEAVPALVHGDLDVASGSISPSLLNAVARGARIRFVAGLNYTAPSGCTSNALMARRALVEAGQLDSVSQLKGRRIDVNRANFAGFYVDKLLNTAGLTLDDVTIEDIPAPAELEALEKGSLDLTTAGEPWVTRMLKAGNAVIWKPAEQVIPDFQIQFILYGPTLLDENPDVGRRFMVVYLKGAQQYNQGKTERNLEILAKYTELDRELLMQVCWPAIRDDGQINVQSVLDYQAWAVEKGYLDSPVTEDQFWDPSFVEYANQVLGTSSQ
jgi:NitT/TauT family transport system substrate-binding protein